MIFEGCTGVRVFSPLSGVALFSKDGEPKTSPWSLKISPSTTLAKKISSPFWKRPIAAITTAFNYQTHAVCRKVKLPCIRAATCALRTFKVPVTFVHGRSSVEEKVPAAQAQGTSPGGRFGFGRPQAHY